MLSDVVREEDLRTIGSDCELVVRLNTTFWSHEWWIGEDDVILRSPELLIRECIIFCDFRSLESMEIEIHSGYFRHTRININTSNTLCEFRNILYTDISLGRYMFECLNEESRCTTSRIEDSFRLLWIYDIDEELNDMTRSAELSSISLASHDGEEILESIPELF